MRTLGLSALLATALAAPSPARPVEPRVVLVVIDDLGWEDLGCGDTPFLDALAGAGLSFTRAWSAPICGPSRAMLMTGRLPSRTGIGSNPGTKGGIDLPDDELTLAELVGGGHAFGKWHLGEALDHPQRAGFAYFAGSPANLQDYYHWEKNTNGQLAPSVRHATVDTLAEALAHPASFLYVAFHAPHKPIHRPPGASEASKAAVLRHLDRAIGRLRLAYPEAVFLVVSDNGAKDDDGVGGKGTFLESGIRVPLIAVGPGVTPGTCDALVNLTDLFATVGELMGVASAAEDSISLVPYFADPGRPPLRSTNYTERFRPSGKLIKITWTRAVRDERYKLVRSNIDGELFFDLENDPREEHPLALQGPAYQRLSWTMDHWF